MRNTASFFNYKLKMSRLLRAGLIALFVTLLSKAVFVDATCGLCYSSHTCTTNTTFQLCFNGVPNTKLNFSCPAGKPICTEFGDVCMTEDVPSGCGDTSKCGVCSNGEMYSCVSRTTFGRCDAGLLLPERSACPTDWFCSISGAASGKPCVLVCDPPNDDTCDRVNNDFATNTTPAPVTPTNPPISPPPTTNTTSSSSSSSSSTSTSTTTPSTPVSPNLFCQVVRRAGRFAIPNDTTCTRFINCFFRANVWQGIIVSCPAEKPFFHATNACGKVRPTGAGCL